MEFEYDPAVATAALAQADRRMAALIEQVGSFGLRIEPLADPFESLVRAIVYQQLSGKAAKAIYQRLCALFPDNRPAPQPLLQLSDDTLRGAGLSRAKIAGIRDLADKTLAGVVPPLAELKAMDDTAIITRLIQIRGVGQWTVEMLLIFRLGRADVLPVTDLGVRKGVMRVCDLPLLPTPAEVRKHGECWRPYRSVASWYLWRAAETITL